MVAKQSPSTRCCSEAPTLPSLDESIGTIAELVLTLLRSLNYLIEQLKGLGATTTNNSLQAGSVSTPPTAPIATEAPLATAGEVSAAPTPAPAAPEATAKRVTEPPVISVPSATTDVKTYLAESFGGKTTVSEREAYLAVVGWGFNVMSEAAGNPKIRKFFNNRTKELLTEQASRGETLNFQSVANTILREAISKKLITREQAEHTKGNAFFAAQVDNTYNSLKGEAKRDEAIEKVAERVNFLIQNPDKNMFRPV